MTQSSGEGWVPTPGQSKSEPLGRISTTSTGLATEISSSISIGSDAEKTDSTKIRFSDSENSFYSARFPKFLKFLFAACKIFVNKKFQIHNTVFR